MRIQMTEKEKRDLIKKAKSQIEEDAKGGKITNFLAKLGISESEFAKAIEKTLSQGDVTGKGVNQGHLSEVWQDMVLRSKSLDEITRIILTSPHLRDNISALEAGDINVDGNRIQVKMVRATIRPLRPWVYLSEIFGGSYNEMANFLINPDSNQTARESFRRHAFLDYTTLSAANIYMIGLVAPRVGKDTGKDGPVGKLDLKTLMEMSVAAQLSRSQFEHIVEGPDSPIKLEKGAKYNEKKVSINDLTKDIFLQLIDERIKQAEGSGEKRAAGLLTFMRASYLGKYGKDGLGKIFEKTNQEADKDIKKIATHIIKAKHLNLRYLPSDRFIEGIIDKALPRNGEPKGQYILHAPSTQLLKLYLTLFGGARPSYYDRIDNYYAQFFHASGQEFFNYFGQPTVYK